MFFKLSSRIAFLLLFAVLFIPVAQAQQDPHTPQETMDVDDEELASIAKAYVSVQVLLNVYEAQFNEVEDPQKANQLQQQFLVEANRIITDEGVTLQRYDHVVRAANEDENLRSRLVTQIEGVIQENQQNE